MDGDSNVYVICIEEKNKGKDVVDKPMVDTIESLINHAKYFCDFMPGQDDGTQIRYHRDCRQAFTKLKKRASSASTSSISKTPPKEAVLQKETLKQGNHFEIQKMHQNRKKRSVVLPHIFVNGVNMTCTKYLLRDEDNSLSI